MTGIDTLPKQLRENARRFPQRVALREKRFGIWQSLTWSEYLDRVRDFALGLVCLGFERGDRLIIIGDNRPEWVVGELAAQALGGASTGIYQDSVAEEIAYIAGLVEAKFIIVEDQEQVDKLSEIREQLPSVRYLIYFDPRGLRSYTEDYLTTFPDVEAQGRDYHRQYPDYFRHAVDAGQGSDTAIISTTSGTTSRPKLAKVTHDNLLSMADGMIACDAFAPDDEFVSFLPLAWIGEQMMSMACGMRVGFALNFPEETDTVQTDLREIGPQIMFAPPRIWENMLSQVQVKIEDTDRFKRWMFNRALATGQRLADKKFNKQPLSGMDRLEAWLARKLVFGNLLNQLGLVRIKWAYTAGAALGPDVFRFYHGLGVNLKQGYGQTETTGICVVHRDDDIKFQTVGTPVKGVEVKTDDSGEIMVRGPVCFSGYFRNDDATRETITPDGWVRTGDAGYFDESGQLIVIDRVKDVMTLHNGTRFSPQFIENKLKFSPYVREAVVLGGGDYPYVTGMINIDFGTVGKWAENNKIAYTTYTDLAQKPQVYTLIRREVERTNADLPPAAQIQRFLLLYKELDADDAELTRTRKVRRGFVAQRYHELVSALYGDQEIIDLETSITYQDGRTANLQVRVRIERMETPPDRAKSPQPALAGVGGR